MPRINTHEEAVVDPDFLDATKWTDAPGAGTAVIANGVLTLTGYIGQFTADVERALEIGALYHYDVIVDSITVAGVCSIRMGGSIPFASAGDPAGRYSGSFIATSTAAPNIFVPALATTMVISRISCVRHGHGRNLTP